MPSEEKRLAITRRYSGPCPDCGGKFVIQKTKDANSPFMGWVECESDACPYEATFDDFRSVTAKARRLADISP